MPQTAKTGGGKAALTEEMRNSKFHQLFMDQVKDIYWAEKKLLKAIPKMEKASTSDELAQAFNKHLNQTQDHVARLEQVFELVGEEPKAVKCEAMAGIVEEAEEMIDETESGSMVRDAALIMAAQKVEHYEIATYGSLRTLAGKMQHTEAVELLDKTLNEEKETDEALTQIAETYVNEEASEE